MSFINELQERTMWLYVNDAAIIREVKFDCTVFHFMEMLQDFWRFSNKKDRDAEVVARLVELYVQSYAKIDERACRHFMCFMLASPDIGAPDFITETDGYGVDASWHSELNSFSVKFMPDYQMKFDHA